jgi:hypothetical protein
MRRRIAGVLVLAALASACVPLRRYPSVAPRDAPVARERLAERLDPWLLSEGLAERVVVEVDSVEGCEPADLVLDGLRDVLVKYGPAGRPVEIERSDVIPRSEWDRLVADGSDPAVGAIVSAHADPVRAPGTEHRYALFAPGAEGFFGYSDTWWVERDDVPHAVRGVFVSRDAHAAVDHLWISLDEIERMTLIHEFGHQLGLVSDPRHERRHPEHRMHCTRLDCAMAHPTARLYLRNVWRGVFDVWFDDYCPECRAEIRDAQAEWRWQRERKPDWAATLREERASEARDRERIGELVRLHRAKAWGDLLAETDRWLEEDSGSRLAHRYRTVALVELGRLDEVAEELASDPDPHRPPWVHAACSVARAWVAEGRHADAVALLGRVMDPRGVAPSLAAPDYEQVGFALYPALEGLGRFEEAAAIVLALDARPPFSYWMTPGGLEILAASLSRRAGDLDRAERVLARVRRSRLVRHLAAEELYRLRVAQGRSAEGRKQLERTLAALRERTGSGNGDGAAEGVAEVLWRARLLALLGDDAGARDELAHAESLGESAGRPEAFATYVAEAHAALGDLDRAAELMRARPANAPDVCALEWAEPLRHDPRHADLLAHCPAR